VIPALSVFYLRRQLKETPRFQLAQIEAREADEMAKREGQVTGVRGVLADRRLLRWLIGASLAWFLFDFVYYGNTISSPIIVKLVAPHASLISQTVYTLAIFAVAALPAYFLAAWTIDRIGRRRMQTNGFIMCWVWQRVAGLAPRRVGGRPSNPKPLPSAAHGSGFGSFGDRRSG
jgi:hypothetical protein